MSEWLARNLSCSSCGSSDAVQESTHHFKCFSCSLVILKREQGDVREQTNGDKKAKSMNKTELIEPGDFHQMKDRNITIETARKCGITTRKYTGTFELKGKYIHIEEEWFWVFNKYLNGQVIQQKIRNCKDKKLMRQFGDTKDATFYGQHLWQPNPNHFCVIVGGEIDCATIIQEVNVACVSVTNGEGSLLSQVIKNQEWLNKWNYIAIGMDNDKAGQTATQAVLDAGVLDPGKIRIITWNIDDPNEMLKQGMTAELKKNVWNAAEYRPDDLIRPSQRKGFILRRPDPGPDTPWSTMTQALQGYMPNRITVVIAYDGIGKSKLIDEMITDLIYNQKVMCWSYSSEQDKDEQIIRQASNRENIPLYIPGTPWQDDIIERAIDDTEDRLIIWEPEGPVTIDTIFAKMKYSAIADQCKVFFIDHLKGIDSQLQDAHNQMGKFLCDIKQFAKKYKVHIILVSHVAKNKKQAKAGQEDESWNRGRVPTKEDAYGSSAITAWADNIIALSRNCEAEDEYTRLITHMHFLKTRLMGVRCPQRAYLKYDLDTNRLKEENPYDYEGNRE